MGRLLLLFSMAKKQHFNLGHPAVPQELLLIPLSIPPEAAVEPAHPKLFQSSTLPPDSPLLDVKWIAAGCQIPDQFFFETHPISSSRSPPLC